MRPDRLRDEFMAPAVGGVERPDVEEFAQGVAVAFLNGVEVAVEVDVDGRHVELQGRGRDLEGLQVVRGQLVAFDHHGAQKRGVDRARREPRGLHDRLDLFALDRAIGHEIADGTAAADDFLEFHVGGSSLGGGRACLAQARFDSQDAPFPNV